MNEQLKEIFSSMKHNKLRTALTGFSVAWGIYMLIILLGAGNGLQNGVSSNFSDRDMNTMTVYPGWTQIAHKGYNKNRKIRFKYEDTEYIQKNVANVINVQSLRFHSGRVAYEDQSTHSNVNGVTSSIYRLKAHKIEKGRYINETDIMQKRKIAVLTKYTADVLFDDEDPMGKLITIDNLGYLVVGVIESSWDNYPNVYIPMTTSLSVYSPKVKDEISHFIIEMEGVNTKAQSEVVEKDIREALGIKYSFSKDDHGALWIDNSIERFMETMLVHTGISTFVWIIGLGTLMIGIIGVSNIMLVSVRERTNEFGIRKSMGATPGSLVRLVLIEAIAITMIFGYIGMVGGTFTLEAANYFIENFTEKTENMPEIFLNPTIDLGIAMYATLVLVIAGTIAGYIPARRAAKLKTIDAMRYNK